LKKFFRVFCVFRGNNSAKSAEQAALLVLVY